MQHPESVARDMPQIPLQVEFKGVCESLQGKASDTAGEQCILLQNVSYSVCDLSRHVTIVYMLDYPEYPSIF